MHAADELLPGLHHDGVAAVNPHHEDATGAEDAPHFLEGSVNVRPEVDGFAGGDDVDGVVVQEGGVGGGLIGGEFVGDY